MTKRAIDYSKTIIYKIVCNDSTKTKLYVGSTTDFIKRKSMHKSVCHNPNQRCYNLKLYQYIRENGGWDNFSMVEIEKYPCLDGNESRSREFYWFQELSANLNCNVPKFDVEKHKQQLKEYYQEHRDEILKHQKEYYSLNRENICQKNNIHGQQPFTCQCGITVRLGNKTQHLRSPKHKNWMINQALHTFEPEQ